MLHLMFIITISLRSHREQTHRVEKSSVKSIYQSMAASKLVGKNRLGIKRSYAWSSGGEPNRTVTAKIDCSAYLISSGPSQSVPLPHHQCKRVPRRHHVKMWLVSSLGQGHFCFRKVKFPKFLHKYGLQETQLLYVSYQSHIQLTCNKLLHISYRGQRMTSSKFHQIQ